MSQSQPLGIDGTAEGADRQLRDNPGVFEDYIRRWFDQEFGRWEIALPEEDIVARRGGHIFAQGWHIGWAWGDADGQEFLDVLAEHRHPGQSVTRLWASGRSEPQPSIGTAFVYSGDATPDEIERARNELFERNERIAADLRSRGLLPPRGKNMAFAEINEFLGTGKDQAE